MTEENFKRGQFTFYRSFYESISRLRSAQKRAQLYECICKYALLNIEPELTDLSLEQRMVMDLILPVLKTGRSKAWNGYLGGSTEKANAKQTGSKKEKEIEIEKEIEKENKNEIEDKKEARASRRREVQPSGQLGEAEREAIQKMLL